MKTFQRILAVVLCLVMSLSVLGTVAFADGDESTTTVQTTATIDTDKTGSITIHKYEYNGAKGNPATGNDDATQLPNNGTDDTTDDPKPLNGAGFTIYKVADLSYLERSYPEISDYVTDGAINSSYTAAQPESKTGTNGVVAFEGLELGLYVVIETTTPDSVTEPCEPFLVSVPMTKVDGSGWLYDIHVYPKNGTSYGKVTLVKKGDDVTSGLVGVTFVLQKQDGTDNDGNTKWINITKQSGAQGDNTGTALNLVTNSEGKIVVEGLSNGTYRFIETDLGENKNGGYILDGATAYTFTVKDGKITYNGKTDDTATIEVINEKPTLDKQVENAAGKWGTDADYSAGDTINYRVKVGVPNNIAQLSTFTVTDVPTHVTDKHTTVKVWAPNSTAQITTGVTVYDKNDGFEVVFTPSALATYKDQEIIITYTATLNEDAITTSGGNPNTATLEYSNMIVPTGDPYNPNKDKTPSTDKISDQAIVYTFKLDVLKTNESSTPLKDVEFDLYLYNGTDTVTEAILKSEGTKIGSYTTGEDGKITVSGLENGNYYLVETKTLEGYNLLKSPVKVEINVAYSTTTNTTTAYNENGDVIATTVTTETFTESSDTANDGIYLTTIINKQGFELPTTGGIGTLMFFIIGGVLIAGGICLITVPNKKRSV